MQYYTGSRQSPIRKPAPIVEAPAEPVADEQPVSTGEAQPPTLAARVVDQVKQAFKWMTG